jgi:hypothetical protein
MTTPQNWRGHINRFIPPNILCGWALDLQDPDNGSLEGIIRLRGKPIGSGTANLFREDLAQFGSGNYGFEIACESEIAFSAILSGDVDILFHKNGIEYGALYIDSTLQLFVGMLEFAKIFSNFANVEARLLRIIQHHTIGFIAEPAARALRSTLTFAKSDHTLLPDLASSFDRDQISGVFFKTGIVSSDQAAILGRNGHMFLIEGSNRVLELFDRPYNNAVSCKTANNWIELIKARHRAAQSRGVQFIQIVIPDKISMMRECLDGTMSSPTATLAALEERSARELPDSSYLSGLAVLTKLPFDSAFRKIDTHLTPNGAFAIFSQICAMIDFSVVGNVVFDVPFATTGDLANRFFGHALYEVCYQSKEPNFKAGRQVVSQHVPESGRHAARRDVFTNDDAPIRKKVVVFGNSFFAGHILQGSINYWMSIWFYEYHFIFSSEIDIDYVAEQNADLVICQTIERFLDVIPKA